MKRLRSLGTGWTLLCITMCVTAYSAEPEAVLIDPSGDKDFDEIMTRSISGERMTYEDRRKLAHVYDLSIARDDDGLVFAKVADGYMKFVKMSLIHPIRHGGWPYRAFNDRKQLNAIREGIKAQYDKVDQKGGKVFFAYSLICPAVFTGHYETAHEAITFIRGNASPFYSREASDLLHTALTHGPKSPYEGLQGFKAWVDETMPREEVPLALSRVYRPDGSYEDADDSIEISRNTKMPANAFLVFNPPEFDEEEIVSVRLRISRPRYSSRESSIIEIYGVADSLRLLAMDAGAGKAEKAGEALFKDLPAGALYGKREIFPRSGAATRDIFLPPKAISDIAASGNKLVLGVHLAAPKGAKASSEATMRFSAATRIIIDHKGTKVALEKEQP